LLCLYASLYVAAQLRTTQYQVDFLLGETSLDDLITNSLNVKNYNVSFWSSGNHLWRVDLAPILVSPFLLLKSYQVAVDFLKSCSSKSKFGICKKACVILDITNFCSCFIVAFLYIPRLENSVIVRYRNFEAASMPWHMSSLLSGLNELFLWNTVALIQSVFLVIFPLLTSSFMKQKAQKGIVMKTETNSEPDYSPYIGKMKIVHDRDLGKTTVKLSGIPKDQSISTGLVADAQSPAGVTSIKTAESHGSDSEVIADVGTGPTVENEICGRSINNGDDQTEGNIQSKNSRIQKFFEDGHDVSLAQSLLVGSLLYLFLNRK